jgi:hypothetical protein
MAQKKEPTAVMPMNSESWSIMDILRSRSVVSVISSGCRDRRSTTSRYPFVDRHCRSWPESMPYSWKTPPVAAGELFTTWPEKASRSAETACETSCGAWVYGRFTRNLEPRSRVSHRSGIHALWISTGLRNLTRPGQLISPTYHYVGTTEKGKSLAAQLVSAIEAR